MTMTNLVRAGLCLVLLGAVSPARAQVDFGAAVGPDALLYGEGKPKKRPPPILPLALATTLALDATTWADLRLSTEPAKDLSDILRKGYYKLELFESILLAKRGKVSLKAVAEAHDKGDSLREIARRKNLDFDVVYEDALALEADVEGRCLPSIMTVSVSTGPLRDASGLRRRKEKK